jgi:hypothetical protein
LSTRQTAILGTGWCEKKAPPFSPYSSKLNLDLLGGGAKKKPPTVFGVIDAQFSTLNLGARGLFFRTDRSRENWFLYVLLSDRLDYDARGAATSQYMFIP